MNLQVDLSTKQDGSWRRVRTEAQAWTSSELLYHAIRSLFGTMHSVRDERKVALTKDSFRRKIEDSPSGFLSVCFPAWPNWIIVIQKL